MLKFKARTGVPEVVRTLDRRLVPGVFTVLVILTIGLLIRWLPGEWTLSTGRDDVVLSPDLASDGVPFSRPGDASEQAVSMEIDWRIRDLDAPVDPAINPAAHVLQQGEQQLKILFEHGGVLLRSGQPQAALVALRLAEALSPTIPEIQVNIGFALYELGRYKEALSHLDRATALRPMQANAYYAAALAYEALGELEGAVGAMRSYLHLSAQQGANERSRLFAVKARAALWEWEARLGRPDSKPIQDALLPSIIPATIRAQLDSDSLSGNSGAPADQGNPGAFSAPGVSTIN